MSSSPIPCPYLPEADMNLDWRSTHQYREKKGPEFFLASLRYAQVLWLRGLPSRALLAVDRALLAEMPVGHELLQEWGIPYQALQWIIANYDEEQFVGNPRVHFQHLASRVRGEREEQRRWRAWACWAIAMRTRPDLPGDKKQAITEPSFPKIHEMLQDHGHPAEAELWQTILLSI